MKMEDVKNIVVAKRGYRAMSWCITLNKYTEDEYNGLLNSEEFSYIILGKEISESGTKHLQGYCQLKDKKNILLE